jgi:acyl-coenzyme A synthetase/AMP-(fatty) acid ligase
MHITDMIRYWARTDPNRPALIQPDLVTSYQALAIAIDSIGGRIAKMGFGPREVVGVALNNPSIFVATVFALLRDGKNAALLNRTLLPLLQPAGIRNLIYDVQGQILSGGKNVRFDPSWLAKPNTEHLADPDRRVEGGDLVYFTSGTTGLPKKVVQTGAALRQLLSYPYTCASGPHQKMLIMPGQSTTFGFNRVCEVLNAGKTVCFAQDSALALALISLHNVDVVVASAVQALALVKAKKSHPGYRVDSIETLFVGGGNIAPESIASIRATLCRNVVNQYGSTEAGVVALTPFDVLNDRPGGVPLPWVELQIIDATGRQLPPGDEGHIRFRTPQLAANLAASDTMPNVRDGWFYPGDLGSLTADGVLRIHGRSSDVINRGGVKVSGARIEQILEGLPQVKEAAACGVLGPSGLEEIWIAIVPDGSVDTEEIKRALREHQDVLIAPDEVFLLDQLPRGELGKVQKFQLKELLLSRKKAA